jgi:hypothetical protein
MVLFGVWPMAEEFILPTAMRSQSTIPRPLALLLLLAVLPLGGCDPIFDVAGAYFPAWIICAISGFILTLVVRDILVRTGLDPHLGWKTLAYLGLFSMSSSSIWLIFFST